LNITQGVNCKDFAFIVEIFLMQGIEVSDAKKKFCRTTCSHRHQIRTTLMRNLRLFTTLCSINFCENDAFFTAHLRRNVFDKLSTTLFTVEQAISRSPHDKDTQLHVYCIRKHNIQMNDLSRANDFLLVVHKK
jgi:hypothetical protein